LLNPALIDIELTDLFKTWYEQDAAWDVMLLPSWHAIPNMATVLSFGAWVIFASFSACSSSFEWWQISGSYTTLIVSLFTFQGINSGEMLRFDELLFHTKLKYLSWHEINTCADVLANIIFFISLRSVD
jgi:hypothetical protein